MTGKCGLMQLGFLHNIAITNLLPNPVLWPQTKKTVVLIELTVPYEEREDEAHKRKRLKYQELVETCRQKEWKALCFAFKVVCRGFPEHSVLGALEMLGITGKDKNKEHQGESGMQAENIYELDTKEKSTTVYLFQVEFDQLHWNASECRWDRYDATGCRSRY